MSLARFVFFCMYMGIYLKERLGIGQKSVRTFTLPTHLGSQSQNRIWLVTKHSEGAHSCFPDRPETWKHVWRFSDPCGDILLCSSRYGHYAAKPWSEVFCPIECLNSQRKEGCYLWPGLSSFSGLSSVDPKSYSYRCTLESYHLLMHGESLCP